MNCLKIDNPIPSPHDSGTLLTSEIEFSLLDHSETTTRNIGNTLSSTTQINNNNIAQSLPYGTT